jgi:hypothetical protein
MRRVVLDEIFPLSSSFGIWLLCLPLLFHPAQAQDICTIPTPLPASQKPNFMSCLSTIQNMSLDCRSKSGYFYDMNAGILTFIGCEAMCGQGIGLWEWKDTFNRLWLLVLPTVVLIAHLAFPPLGWHNYVVVTFHAVGNPVGSLRSLLTRCNKHRQLRCAAKKIFPQELQLSEAVATVFAAYEELGWHDVSTHFKEWVPENLGLEEKLIITRASRQLSSPRLSSTLSASVAIVTLVGTLAAAILRTIQQIDENNTRVYIDTAHTIAVVCILFISIPQVWFSARLGTFTTESDAIYIINTMNNSLTVRANGHAIFPPIEQLASCPSQPSTRDPWLSGQLRTRLELWLSRHGLSWLEEFFTHCTLPHDNPESRIFHQNSQERSSQLSINPSWRPCPHFDTDGKHHYKLLLLSVLWVISGAFLPAIFLSATNHADTRKIAIGCRSMTWSIIMGTWLLSFVSDSVIRWLICRRYTRPDLIDKIALIWRWTVYKDAFVTFVVVVLILVVEVGTYNSCWCRVSFSHPAIVNIMPYSPSQWKTAQTLWIGLPSAGLVVNFSLIMCVELHWKEWNGKYPRLSREGGSPLCKNRKETEKELDELNMLEGRLHREREGSEVVELQQSGQESNHGEDTEPQSFLLSILSLTVHTERD